VRGRWSSLLLKGKGALPMFEQEWGGGGSQVGGGAYQGREKGGEVLKKS